MPQEQPGPQVHDAQVQAGLAQAVPPCPHWHPAPQLHGEQVQAGLVQTVGALMRTILPRGFSTRGLSAGAVVAVCRADQIGTGAGHP